jgi:hypothetical protein
MYAGIIKNEWFDVIMLATSGLVIFSLFFAFFEPGISRAATNTFTITQTVTSEISFVVPATTTTMVGSLGGVTGGTATGTAQAAVQTNSTTGYTMDISFSNSPAMRGNTSASTAIGNYGTTSVPTYTFFTGSTSAVFGYSVNASTTSDVAAAFKNDGTSCNTGSTVTQYACWQGATSTGNFRIISRNVAATTSATTTLTFKVYIPNNPVPAVTSDTYTATATLTALVQ